MTEIAQAFATAGRLIATGDAALLEIVALSLRVTGAAVVLAALIGLPLGALLGVTHFPGRRVITVALNTGMALPPVVVGLALYLLFSRSGPLGEWQLLFTPSAMVIAQAALVTPIVASLSRQTIEDLAREYDEQLRAFGVGRARAAATLLFEARYSLPTALLAGLGRAIAEVGAVMIVGGNIAHVTRTMT
ncbi:MAG TPA: ABC transporter permease, partial [Myxococcota bacterium]|nr:ABC transporter permease [Myxococcota bacterium]